MRLGMTTWADPIRNSATMTSNVESANFMMTQLSLAWPCVNDPYENTFTTSVGTLVLYMMFAENVRPGEGED